MTKSYKATVLKKCWDGLVDKATFRFQISEVDTFLKDEGLPDAKSDNHGYNQEEEDGEGEEEDDKTTVRKPQNTCRSEMRGLIPAYAGTTH